MSAFSTNALSRFASVVDDGVPGPPRLARHTVSLYLCSSGSNAQGESRALEGRHISSKSPSRVLDGDEEVAGRNERESKRRKRISNKTKENFSQERKQKKLE